jgi:hypothetical protein
MRLKDAYLKSILQAVSEGIGSAEQIAASTTLKRSLVNVYMEFLADEGYIKGAKSFPSSGVGELEYCSAVLLQKGKLAIDDLSDWVFQEDTSSTVYDLRGAQFGGGFATGGGVQVGGTLTPISAERPVPANSRLVLIQTLNALPSSQFDALMFALAPPSGSIPSSAAAQGSRSAALLQWAEGPTGPGLPMLESVLTQLMRH